ncbi:hypothetical protein [Thalassotalea castellviae]|uniref:Uncharacterized protein n=1 Tax=Thalassotalea castellviae TaxID=3075612 RepID=A0ABU2ZXN7_9GAMM|nr:hypothetical protein [Thalassotalea sp. W431]MDT0602674.1 hypothetical protein [Thalassotalea sp. W431]
MSNSKVNIEITKRRLFDLKPVKFESGTIFYLHVALPNGKQVGKKVAFVDSLQLEFDEDSDEVCAPYSLIAKNIEDETCFDSWFVECEELDAMLMPLNSYESFYRELVLEAKIKLWCAQESTCDDFGYEAQQSELIEKASSKFKLLIRKHS